MLRLAFFLFLTLSAANALADTENQGFIYGSVATDRGDTLTGFLRWDNEEAYWDVFSFCTFLVTDNKTGARLNQSRPKSTN